MKIASIKTDLSPDQKIIWFTARATSSIPADATASVMIFYKYETPTAPELPPGTEEPKKPTRTEAEIEADKQLRLEEQAKQGQIFVAERPLESITIEGNNIQGFVDLETISGTMIERFYFKASFSEVTVEIDSNYVLANDQKEELELPDSDDTATITKVRRLWYNYNTSRVEFWASSAYLDLSKAVSVDANIPQQFGFPGIYAPKQISEDDFNALLVSPKADLVKKNGEVYSVKTPTGLKRVAILFSNSFRTYAEYFTYSTVYQLSLPNALVITHPIQSQDIVRVKDSVQTFTTDDLEIPSAHFNSEILAELYPYKTVEIAFDRRVMIDRNSSSSNFSITESGSANTYI